jgi:hypothetical protein
LKATRSTPKAARCRALNKAPPAPAAPPVAAAVVAVGSNSSAYTTDNK